MQQAILFLTAIFLTNAAGMQHDFYYKYWWFDMTLHFLGGFFVAMLMVHYLTDVKSQSKLKNYLVIVGAVSFIGVVWEFTEYLASQTLIEPLYKYFQFKAYFVGDLDDTINDLLLDILGAVSWLAIYKKN